ncbi:hypothetical protein A9Z42_0066930 [Trichoderma parareesei]|uniref:FHA domain-containing protein n=1 Tax=Trichoderma parareesei TaxID=858221 RepID=A0A2H2ZVG5_TRIPA|nr:hypothetical protein A9Z42_0066930 [Trichoderma parareesei]
MASPIQAVVNLTAIDPPEWFVYPVRRLLLDSTKSVASIGRMSSRNGDYTAKESNGWMESAVMSRNHATLLFDPQAQRVFIKDVGSLHGTFYNETRLQKHQSQALKDGDILQFGIAIARGSDTCPPCKMRVGVEFRPCSSVQGPTVFRVPDDSDEESEEEYIEDENIRWSTQILRDNGIRPAKNCISRNPVITIDESDNEMDSPAPETEEQTVSARSVQDHMTDKTGSDKSPSRIHTPRETIDIPDDISDDDPMFYEDEYDGDEVTDSDDDHSSLGEHTPHDTLGGSFLDKSHDGSRPDATEIHEAEVYDRFENDCLPPILEVSPANAASASNQPRPSVHLPSLFDSFRSQEIPTAQDELPSDPVAETESAIESAAPLERDWPNWPKDVAESRATESSRLLDSGVKFLETPLKEQDFAKPAVEPPLELDETSAYQFQVTKTYFQQQPPYYHHQHDESSSADSTGDQPAEPQERAAPNKRKAEEISEVTVEEIAFARSNPVDYSASPSLRPRALDVEMDVSPAAAHSAVEGPQAKRLRKAAEIFGYAALGGVAVMSALIATAPTL